MADNGALGRLDICAPAGRPVSVHDWRDRFYPGAANQYEWPLPMVQSSANPTVISAPGSSGGFTDTNGPPNSYEAAYYATSFDATQCLWWICPCCQNATADFSTCGIVQRALADSQRIKPDTKRKEVEKYFRGDGLQSSDYTRYTYLGCEHIKLVVEFEAALSRGAALTSP